MKTERGERKIRAVEKLTRLIFIFIDGPGKRTSLDDREISPYSSLIAFSVDLLKVVSQFSMQSILICMKLANAGKF